MCCSRFSPVGSGPPDGRDRASEATWTFKLSWPSTMTASSLDSRVSPGLQQHLKVLWVSVLDQGLELQTRCFLLLQLRLNVPANTSFTVQSCCLKQSISPMIG